MADKAVEIVADGDAGELLGADIGGAEEGELTGVKVRVSQEEVVADGVTQNRVSQELQTLVGHGPREGRVCEGFF